MRDESQDERSAERPLKPLQPKTDDQREHRERERQEAEAERQYLQDLETIERSERERSRSSKLRQRIFYLSLVFGPAVALLAWLGYSVLNGGLEPSSSNRFEAKLACERAVEAQLISPSSANVTTLTYAQGTDDPENWRFTGEVTAENAFGARLTSSWGCTYKDGSASAFIN
jgi:hypothetical protein